MSLRYRLGQIAAYVIVGILGACFGWAVMDLIDSRLPRAPEEYRGQNGQQDQAGKGLEEAVKKAVP